jgi:glycosyltransferase involved in cell wall biosynthesis
LPEVVGNDGAALLVPPRDARAIADAVFKLIKNPDLRRRMGKAARKRILELFTWQNAARRMVEVYREVIDAHR